MTAVVKWILFRRTLKGVCFMTCIVRPRPVMCTISSHKVLRRFLPSSDQTEQTELDSRHALHSNNLYWGILLHLVSSLLSSNNVLNPFFRRKLSCLRACGFLSHVPGRRHERVRRIFWATDLSARHFLIFQTCAEYTEVMKLFCWLKVM